MAKNIWVDATARVKCEATDVRLEVIIICLVFVSDEEAQYGKKRRLRIVVR
jgi:hypothetical protein